MSEGDSDFRVRPGRIRSTRAPRPKSFINQVLRAAKKAGHVGGGAPGASGRSGGAGTPGRSTFGRGRLGFSRSRLFSPSRRVVVAARIARHSGKAFRSAPLAAHLAYLKRDGVSREGEKGILFDAGSDRADDRAFTEQCKDDRHHFRFIVSPEDAVDLTDLKAFTRDLVRQMEADLGTRLDWVAVDHWNTNNPHVHLLVRGVTWPGSAIVHDIKGENWQLTAGFRARHGKVVLFDPTNPESSPYNPLLEIRRGDFEVRDVQNVADVLVDPEGSLDRRNHWEKTSHSLLVGAILHVLYAGDDKTLSGVAAFLSDPRRPIEATLRAMMTTRHLGEDGPHPVVASTARELLNKSDNERSGVLSTAMSFLGLYRDPVVAQVTRRCDWRIADLIADERPVSLYLVVPPSDISRTKPLIRLVLNQIGRRLTEDLHARDRRHRVLMMLDEFPALGRLDFFESALAFMAGYKIKAFLIAQSLNQIEKAYGANNSILDNCHVRVSFAANDERTAKRISDSLGTATEMRAMRNYAGHRLSPWLGHLMVSRQETARPLLTPGEVMQLPPADEIVMVAGTPPIKAKKARYYEDHRFTERVLSPPDPSHTIRTSREDDWTTLAPQRPDADLVAELAKAEADTANSGLRREPELPDHVAIAKETTPVGPADEFAIVLDDEPDDTAQQARVLRQQMRGVARQAALDPHDGIDL